MDNSTNTSSPTHQVAANSQDILPTGDHGPADSAPASEPPTTAASGAPTLTTTDPAMIQVWDQCWSIIKNDPSNFETWEELMRLVDGQDGGFGQDAPSANMTNVRTIYDAFLKQFPLCFGYWKKYSDLEFLARGVEGAIEIFERGVKSVPNSVDLWIQYCSFVMEQKSDDRNAIEQLFERGAKLAGMDFMPHVFWDKYIAFFEEKGEYAQLIKLMQRIIKIPMHQYARFFEKYAQLISSRPLNEIVSDEEYKKYKDQVVPQDTVGKEQETKVTKSEDQIAQEIRNLVLEASTQVYGSTANETNKRWPFEAEIKRPYFHVKPMDAPQLSNWRRYLDFEETEGDVERIRILYERCLVTCALYEEFWLRYGTWARTVVNLDELQEIYARAATFIPSSNPSARLTLAMIEEERGQAEEARKQYQTVLEQLPGHIETITRYASFERRHSPQDLSAAEMVYASQLGVDNVDEVAQTAIVTLYAKFLWQIKKDSEAARVIFKTGEGKFSSRFYFSNYLKFEMECQGADYEERVSNVFEQARSSSLPEAVKYDFNQSYLDFVMEFGTSAARYNNLEADLKAPSVYVAESKKRAAAEQEEQEGRAKKQSKEDDVAMATTDLTAVVPVDTSAYAQQAQWGTGAHQYYGYPATAYPV